MAAFMEAHLTLDPHFDHIFEFSKKIDGKKLNFCSFHRNTEIMNQKEIPYIKAESLQKICICFKEIFG